MIARLAGWRGTWVVRFTDICYMDFCILCTLYFVLVFVFRAHNSHVNQHGSKLLAKSVYSKALKSSAGSSGPPQTKPQEVSTGHILYCITMLSICFTSLIPTLLSKDRSHRSRDQRQSAEDDVLKIDTVIEPGCRFVAHEPSPPNYRI